MARPLSARAPSWLTIHAVALIGAGPSGPGAAFGGQRRRVVWRHLENLRRLTREAYRTRLGNRLAVDEKPKQHAIRRDAHSARFHVFGPRPVDAVQSRND